MKYPNIKLTALMLAAVLTAPVCTAATGDIYNYEFTALGTTISSQIKADNKEKAQFCANVVKKGGCCKSLSKTDFQQLFLYLRILN